MGSKLKELREKHKIPLRTLGAIVGISAANLNKIERGECEPGVQNAIRIARFFETTAEELFGEEGQE